MAVHFWRFTKQYGHGQVHRLVSELAITDGQMLCFGGLPHHGVGTPLASTNRFKLRKLVGFDREHIALLRLVAPDLQRRHPGFVVGDITQLKAPPTATIFYQFGKRIAEPASTHIMNKCDGVFRSKAPAGIDNLLAAPLYFGILSLYRGEIEILRAVSACHGRGRSAAQSNQHGGASQYNEFGSRRVTSFRHVLGTNISEAAGDHDRLVVTADPLLRFDLDSTEIAGEVGATELIVKGSGPNGTLGHDLQGGDNSSGSPVMELPRSGELWEFQVRYSKAGQARLGPRAAPYRTFITNLAAGASSGACEWRDRRGVIVGFHLHEQVDGLFVVAPHAVLLVGVETPC